MPYSEKRLKELSYAYDLDGGGYAFENPAIADLVEASAVVWADESLAITQEIYADLPTKEHSKAYCQRFYPTVLKRLQLAGWRLATLLDQALVP